MYEPSGCAGCEQSTSNPEVYAIVPITIGVKGYPLLFTAYYCQLCRVMVENDRRFALEYPVQYQVVSSVPLTMTKENSNG